MSSHLFGEFMGTMLLVLLGNGVVAGALLEKSKAQNAGWIVITAGWGFAVMFAVFLCVACGGTEAHLNPAVTIGFAVATGDWSRLPFIPAQIAGAMCGALLVWIYYINHFAATKDPELKLACFSTIPAIRRYGSNLVNEAIGTFILITVIAAFNSKPVAATGNAAGLATGYGPYLVGSLVWAIGLSLGSTTGYAINPARDLGPRFMHAILPIPGKGSSDWAYAPVPIIGPIIGAVLSGLFIRAAGL